MIAPVHKEKKAASKPKNIQKSDVSENTGTLRTLLAKEDDLLAKLKEQEAEIAHLREVNAKLKKMLLSVIDE